jgi:hypothetical protein
MAVGASAIRDHGPPKRLLNREENPIYNPEPIMARYTEHFAFVFGGGGEVSAEAWEGLEVEV